MEITGQTANGERSVVAGKLILGRGLLARSNVATVREVLLRDPAVSVSANGRIGLMGLPGYTEVLLDGDPPPLGLNPLSLPPAQVGAHRDRSGAARRIRAWGHCRHHQCGAAFAAPALPLDWSAELGAPAYNQSARVRWTDGLEGCGHGAQPQPRRQRPAQPDGGAQRASGVGGRAGRCAAWRSTSRSQGHHDNLNLAAHWLPT